MTPPLPRARLERSHRKPGGRRARAKRGYIAVRVPVRPDPFAATSPNPFGGPPATATTYNPGRNNSASH